MFWGGDMKSYCKCWVKYPNELQKKSNGKWKCVDKYKCIKQLGRDENGKKHKTKCERIDENE